MGTFHMLRPWAAKEDDAVIIGNLKKFQQQPENPLLQEVLQAAFDDWSIPGQMWKSLIIGEFYRKMIEEPRLMMSHCLRDIINH